MAKETCQMENLERLLSWQEGQRNALEELGELKRISVLFRSHPDYAAPESFVESIKKLVASQRLEIL